MRLRAVQVSPRRYTVKAPGDLVQVDTLDVRSLPGVVIKQFAARDMISLWDVIEAFRSATACNARSVLETLQQQSAYPVQAIQVDGGSELQAEFE